jgi:D-arabinose 1-dehydrogenase-like Zn-dependent alcohol dehydrogenase
MRAALLTEIGKPLTIADIPPPEPGPNQVLVRTHACGICRTDLHIASGLAYRPALPHILGHEPAGIVERVGAEVRSFAPGDPVAPYLFLYCGVCRACAAHDEAQCSNPKGILGVSVNGAFADYFVIREENLVRVPEAVSLDVAGLMGCAAITAVRALARADLASGQRGAVIGVGGIGVLLVQGLAAAGVDVAAFSRSEAGRQHGLENGASTAFALENPVIDEATGFDRIFDLVGTAKTMALAGHLARRGGRIIVVGEEPDFPAIDTTSIAQRELEIRGTRNGARAQADEAMGMMAAGILRPQVAAKVPLADINEAFAAMERGAVHGRMVVDLS